MRGFRNVVAALVLLAGCGGPAQVTLSARVGAAKLATSQQPLKQGLTLDNGIAIDRIRIAVKELELTPVGAASTDDSHKLEIEKGPYLLDLSGAALDGSVVQLLASEIPSGDYHEVEFKISPVGDDTSDASFDDLKKANASVIVDGTIDGAAFSFSTGLIAEQEYEGALTVASGANNITLNIDASKWFVDATGARLDPTSAAAKSAIEANIRASLAAFEDDDHDGSHDDHGSDDGVDDHGTDGGTDDSGHH